MGEGQARESRSGGQSHLLLRRLGDGFASDASFNTNKDSTVGSPDMPEFSFLGVFGWAIGGAVGLFMIIWTIRRIRQSFSGDGENLEARTGNTIDTRQSYRDQVTPDGDFSEEMKRRGYLPVLQMTFNPRTAGSSGLHLNVLIEDSFSTAFLCASYFAKMAAVCSAPSKSSHMLSL